MKEEELIKQLEENISNLESMKYKHNIKFDNAIERLKKIKFNLKYKD